MAHSLLNDTFLRALRRQPTAYTPIWLMRQAGRYLPEYNATRSRAGSFLALAKTPDLATEVTLQPLERYPLDAAILFSDILTVPDAMGLGLDFLAGEGPKFARPVRSEADVARLAVPDIDAALRYVTDAVRQIRRALTDGNGQQRVPLIGFSGSPWTLACYMVEGGGSADFRTVKSMLYARPDLMARILDVNAQAVAAYLNAQIDAGAQAVMIFDTWGGVLADGAYQRFSLRYIEQVVAALRREQRDQCGNECGSGHDGEHCRSRHDGEHCRSEYDGECHRSGRDGEHCRSGHDGECHRSGRDDERRRSEHDGEHCRSGHDGECRRSGRGDEHRRSEHDGEYCRSGYDGECHRSGRDDEHCCSGHDDERRRSEYDGECHRSGHDGERCRSSGYDDEHCHRGHDREHGDRNGRDNERRSGYANARVPVIAFTKGGGLWLDDLAATGVDAVGLDWTVNLAQARARVGERVALQGNLDPAVLFAPPPDIRAQARAVLDSFGAHPGHVFNLGHGISPLTPPESVAELVDEVHRHSRAIRAGALHDA